MRKSQAPSRSQQVAGSCSSSDKLASGDSGSEATVSTCAQSSHELNRGLARIVDHGRVGAPTVSTRRNGGGQEPRSIVLAEERGATPAQAHSDELCSVCNTSDHGGWIKCSTCEPVAVWTHFRCDPLVKNQVGADKIIDYSCINCRKLGLKVKYASKPNRPVGGERAPSVSLSSENIAKVVAVSLPPTPPDSALVGKKSFFQPVPDIEPPAPDIEPPAPDIEPPAPDKEPPTPGVIVRQKTTRKRTPVVNADTHDQVADHAIENGDSEKPGSPGSVDLRGGGAGANDEPVSGGSGLRYMRQQRGIIFVPSVECPVPPAGRIAKARELEKENSARSRTKDLPIKGICDCEVVGNVRWFGVEFADKTRQWCREPDLIGCYETLVKFIEANDLEPTSLRSVFGAKSEQTAKTNSDNWVSIEEVLSMVETYSKGRNYEEVVHLRVVGETGVDYPEEGIYIVMIERHLVVALYVEEHSLAYVADGVDSVIDDEGYKKRIQKILKTRVKGLRFGQQKGIDHCGSSAAALVLEFARLYQKENRKELMKMEKIAVERSRYRTMVATRHKEDSEPLRRGRINIANVEYPQCGKCGEKFKRGRSAMLAHQRLCKRVES